MSKLKYREPASITLREIIDDHPGGTTRYYGTNGGEGDQRTFGYRLPSGYYAIETNGDPIFEFDEGFAEAWAEIESNENNGMTPAFQKQEKK